MVRCIALGYLCHYHLWIWYSGILWTVVVSFPVSFRKRNGKGKRKRERKRKRKEKKRKEKKKLLLL